MTQRIRRFGVGQTAKVLGVLYALMGFVALPFLLLGAMFSPSRAGWSMGFAVVLPVLYGLCGFVFTAIGCVVYNLVASWVGGIEVEIGETPA